MTAIGHAASRVDGILKISGRACYTGDFSFPGMVHAVLLSSSIAHGRLLALDEEDAKQVPGFLALMSHANLPLLGSPCEAQGGQAGEQREALSDECISYAGQIIGVVIAETWEAATEAAGRIRIRYEEKPPQLALDQGEAYPLAVEADQEMKVRRGDVQAGVAIADVRVSASYYTPIEHHHPMEPSGAIALWEGDELTLYEPTQNVMGLRAQVAARLGLAPDKVRVISKFVGGGFGCKGSVWHHSTLAAWAARLVGRPVKLLLSRHDMVANVGHRSQTRQEVMLAAKADGELTAIRHMTTAHTSWVDEFPESCGWGTRFLYACPNLEVDHSLVRLNIGTPGPMRAPGEATGTFALESAMDELAHALNMDPLALRLRNHADISPHDGLPWSSKHLKACYQRGAERFGWSRRPPTPRAMRDGHEWIGYGMATAIFPGYRAGASAQAILQADGTVVVRSATHDIGTGTYTIMTQIAADTLGLPTEQVRFELGDSRFPHAPVSGGSMTAGSVGPAVRLASENLKRKLVGLAVHDADSPLHGFDEDDIVVDGIGLRSRSVPARRDRYMDLLQRRGLAQVEALGEASLGEERKCYAFQSFGAQFAEVRVDEDLGQVRVSRFVGVYDVGRIMNPKTARSQVLGGVTFGIGMALMEHTELDPQSGRILSDNLADYLLPVNADIPDIQVDFINEPDPHANALGVRGIGEVGTTGVAAAIANAVFHATGKRIRDLPILPEKLL